jgi:hypothetical protein
MSLLVDKQINERLTGTLPLATEVPTNDFTRGDSKIQAASLDLTIGAIYIPGADVGTPGSANSPLVEHSLASGQTAVIRTKETLDLGSDLAAICFPPAGLSLKGLLMTIRDTLIPATREVCI